MKLLQEENLEKNITYARAPNERLFPIDLVSHYGLNYDNFRNMELDMMNCNDITSKSIIVFDYNSDTLYENISSCIDKRTIYTINTIDNKILY